MSNSATISGTLVTQTDASTASYCVISGYLQDLQGVMMKGRYLIVRYFSVPAAISTSNLVIGERIVVRADTNGRISVKLLQGAKVKIEIPNRRLDMVRMCNVPESLTANLIDIVFPRVVSAAFSLSSKNISVGEDFSVTVNATMSDGETEDVTYCTTIASSNTAIATVSGTTVTGVGSGTSTISISALDTTKLDSRKEPDGDLIVVQSEANPDITSTMDIVVS